MVEPHGRSGIHDYTLALVAALSSKDVDVAIVGALDADWSNLPSDVVVERRLESFLHTPLGHCPSGQHHLGGTPPGGRQINSQATQTLGSVVSKSQAAGRQLTLSQS